jgi:hypothetical protein
MRRCASATTGNGGRSSWRTGSARLARRRAARRRAAGAAAAGAPRRPPFYRVEEGRLQVFHPDGEYRDIARPEGVLLLQDVKRRSKPLLKSGAASLWDIGDGVACFEVHTKMNALDPRLWRC